MLGLNGLLCLLLILCVGMFKFALLVWLYLVLLQAAFVFCLVRFDYYCWLVVINGHGYCGMLVYDVWWLLWVRFAGWFVVLCC